jgi:hypothetical protein
MCGLQVGCMTLRAGAGLVKRALTTGADGTSAVLNGVLQAAQQLTTIQKMELLTGGGVCRLYSGVCSVPLLVSQAQGLLLARAPRLPHLDQLSSAPDAPDVQLLHVVQGVPPLDVPAAAIRSSVSQGMRM